MEKKWYTLRVYSGQETKVKAHLENEIQFKGLQEEFGRVVVPSEPVLEMRNGKKRLKNKVFFPGYVLIEMNYNTKTSFLVLETPGVLGFIGPKNRPEVVKPEEVEFILRKVERQESEVEKVEVPFQIGDVIRVVDGPFADFTGVVEEINEEKKKVKVSVSIFGRPTPVELDFLQVHLEE
ncbi:MAG TPA: transcription termination/antitermination protein NusG [Calditrichia bacterium]|nr:transcription termination/antitermination protein NusG [Calditrichota bacterium]HQU70776.1 transcription termination/antitermination protein NusG [Calditrichia bacterium]HQV32813.1 transcription termination/antitermination protein NusG [Calditrichia bacterium]